MAGLNLDDKSKAREVVEKLDEDEKRQLDERVRKGETVIPGGTGGKSVEAQANLAAGRSRGGLTRRDELGTEGYKEMGKKGGLSTMDKSGGERAEEEGISIDDSKYTTSTTTRGRQAQSQ